MMNYDSTTVVAFKDEFPFFMGHQTRDTVVPKCVKIVHQFFMYNNNVSTLDFHLTIE